MVNDSHCKPNSAMRVIPFGGRSRLCLFAIKSIPAGVELRYGYGVGDLPWRMVSAFDKFWDFQSACHFPIFFLHICLSTCAD